MGLEQDISRNLRKIRHDMGMSQRELAEITDFDEKFLSQLENKPRHVSTKTLERLAIGLKTDIANLLANNRRKPKPDPLPKELGPGLDEAIKILKMHRQKVKG